jgi:hypothetical protein
MTAQVSRVEKEADPYLSALRSCVHAMDCEFDLRAVFPSCWDTLRARTGRRTVPRRSTCIPRYRAP